MADLAASLRAALSRPGAPSSDFDLNPAVERSDTVKLREAGVLIAVTLDGPEPRVLLTKRSSGLQHHPGQIAFPGGKVEDSDGSPEAAALRESWEEIGLPPDRVEILGSLPAHETVTSYSMVPVLGLVRDAFTPTPEAGEVEEVFTVPLAHVLDRSRYGIESRIWQGRKRSYYAVPYGPYYIWGATARILRGLAERAAQ